MTWQVPSEALKLPVSTGKLSRRSAMATLLPASVFMPSVAIAKYRPSLAEMKGYGNSPIVDEMRDNKAAQTSLSFAQLVANSKKMQEDQSGRPMTEEELKILEDKIRKYYPTAK